MIRNKAIRLLAVFLVWIIPGIVFGAVNLGEVQQKIPDALIYPGSSNRPILVVDKSTQRLFVYYHKDGQYFLYKTFPVSTGEKLGKKRREGDKKTPEGFYIFNMKFLERELADIYGILAFPIDYPNFWDKKVGNGGSNIWLHGTNRELIDRDSNGCLALNNIDVLELESLIQLYNTPIIIYNKITYKDNRSLLEEAKALKQFIENWRSSWADKKFKQYRGFYSRDFVSDSGMDYTAWMKHKNRLNKKYAKINVDIKNVRIFKYLGVITVTFDQFYKTRSFTSNGKKRLYINSNAGGYSIAAEVWAPFPPKPRRKVLPLSVRNRVIEEDRKSRLLASSTKKVKQKPKTAAVKADSQVVYKLLENWLAAWRREDIDGYISSYHPDFKFKRMNLAAYKKYKEKMFERHSSITIGVQKLKLKFNGDKAKVTFIQDFRSASYKDRGIKTVVLVKHSNKWRIREEKWHEIKAGAKP